MPLVRVGVVILCLLLAAPAWPADGPSPGDYQQAESRVRSAVEAWAYQQWWTLWDMGNELSQFQVPREEFVRRMSQSLQKSVGGRQVEAIQVFLSSTTYGTAHVRLGARDTVTGSDREIYRAFTVQRESGDWRISLHEFLGLAR